MSRSCTSPSDSSRPTTYPPSRVDFASTATLIPSTPISRVLSSSNLTAAEAIINHILHPVHTSQCRSAADSAASGRPRTTTRVSVLLLSVQARQTLVSQELFPFLSSVSRPTQPGAISVLEPDNHSRMTSRPALTIVPLTLGFGQSTGTGFGQQPATGSNLFGASTNTGGGFGGMSQYTVPLHCNLLPCVLRLHHVTLVFFPTRLLTKCAC